MDYVKQQLTGERALFRREHLKVEDCVFNDGESPLKECTDISVSRSSFLWKYPVWYSRKVTLRQCYLGEMARAGLWYDQDVTVRDTLIKAPKCFRRCDGILLSGVRMPAAEETLWDCSHVQLEDVTAAGDYFCKDTRDLTADRLRLEGNYGFDGCRNLLIRRSVLHTKDSFWNCENVVVEDSEIVGEYVAWNSKNVTFRRCRISSLQGLCYVENLVLEDCDLADTNRALEYSSVNASVNGRIESVVNPKEGWLRAGEIGTLVLSEGLTDPDRMRIECPNIGRIIRTVPEGKEWDEL